MADIQPFCAVRPRQDIAGRIAALPYDVYKRADALAEVTREPMSFLHIDRPETWFDDSVDIYDPRVYDKAREVLWDWIGRGYFIQDDRPCYYLYEERLDGRSQTGIVACASVNDYLAQVIKKHENTRESKEMDRIRHIEACQAQTGPIFLAYRAHETLAQITGRVMSETPLYDFTAPDGVIQRVWRIDDAADIAAVHQCFLNISDIYIADGHHRAASAVKVALRRREALGYLPQQETGDESDRFLCVLFPDTDLKIMPYHRLVRDLGGHSKNELLTLLDKNFNVTLMTGMPPKGQPFPEKKAAIGMYLDRQWYLLETKTAPAPSDVIASLDVSILQKAVLEPVFGIRDVRTDKRIDFVGGLKDSQALADYCDRHGFAAAFAMYPTSMEELFAVADNHGLMPPKSTWFEPKLRSGLFIHLIGTGAAAYE